MPFTRDDMKAYESQKPAVVPDAPAADPDPAPPAATPPAAAPAVETEAPAADPSPAVATDPAAPDDASSGDPAASPAAADPSNSDPPPPDGKPRTIPMERFEVVNDEKNALKAYGKLKDEENQRLREEVARLQGRVPGAEQPAPAAPVSADDPMPTLASVKHDEAAYQKAMKEWLDRRDTRVVARARNEIVTQQIRDTYVAREAAFAKDHPDYQTVVVNPALPKLSQGVAKVIVMSDDGPSIMYHLAKNPDEAVRLSRLDSEQQLVRLGEIRTKLAAAAAPASTTQTPAASATPAKTPATKPAQRTVTKAPPPPTPNPGGSAAQKNPSEMSMEEFVAHERAQKVADRAARRKARDEYGR